MYKLLIVDDEMWSRRLIREVLNWQDLDIKQIHEAENGIDALKLLNQHHHDIMIMDMKMPQMDGIQLLNQMDKKLKTQIIVMSGYDDFSYLKQALQVKAIDYLLKPIIKAELERAVKQAMTTIRQSSVQSELLQLATNLETNKLFIKYLNLRNQLYSAIISKDEAAAVQDIEMIKSYLKQNEQQYVFHNYIYLDLKFMMEELQETNLSKSQKITIQEDVDKIHPIDYVLMQAKAIIHLMNQTTTRGKLYIDQVVNYVDIHYMKNMTLESLASIFFISKEHLSRAFKQHTKHTVSEYVNDKRIAYAQQLMGVRKFSPKTAAAMAGFVHLHYFYRVFKIKTGMTPIQYAKKQNINIV
jgi:two-component system, response regulator YesN